MAVDFVAVKLTVDTMHRRVGVLSQLVDEAASGGYESAHLSGKSFTAAEKTNLTDQYNALKAELVILFGLLP